MPVTIWQAGLVTAVMCTLLYIFAEYIRIPCCLRVLIDVKHIIYRRHGVESDVLSKRGAILLYIARLAPLFGEFLLKKFLESIVGYCSLMLGIRWCLE